MRKHKPPYRDFFGYTINADAIISTNAACYDKLADTDALIQEKITRSEDVNSDENGVRCIGFLDEKKQLQPKKFSNFNRPNKPENYNQ